MNAPPSRGSSRGCLTGVCASRRGAAPSAQARPQALPDGFDGRGVGAARALRPAHPVQRAADAAAPPARDRRRDLLRRPHRLPVAQPSARRSAVEDGLSLLLKMAPKWVRRSFWTPVAAAKASAFGATLGHDQKTFAAPLRSSSATRRLDKQAELIRQRPLLPLSQRVGPASACGGARQRSLVSRAP